MIPTTLHPTAAQTTPRAAPSTSGSRAPDRGSRVDPSAEW